MIISMLIILVGGFISGFLINKIKIPKLVGMIIFGVLVGPSVLNIISPDIFEIANILRQVALVIIITRAGLNLDFKALKENGLQTILLSFIPATFEIVGVLIFGPIILKISVLEALLLGSVLAAVSPAVIVPRMIKLKKSGYKDVGEVILVGASVDDVYVIVLFYTFLGIIKNDALNFGNIIQIPTSIILGVILGLLIGVIIVYLFKKLKTHNYFRVLIVLLISLALVFTESQLFKTVKVVTLLSVLSLNVYLKYQEKENIRFYEKTYQTLWFIFEIVLFVLVGLALDFTYVINFGFKPLIIILIGLVFRSLGVLISLFVSNFTIKQKIFIIFSYLPKATVQASIGAIALLEGLSVGPLVLTVAVVSILFTAPLGALLIDHTYQKLLTIDT